MFFLLAIIGGFGFVGAVWWWFVWDKKAIPTVAVLLCAGIFVGSWFTPQGEVYWLQFVSSSQTGNWLVVDNSGGQTLRHWILVDSYVGDNDQSDGYKFKSADGIARVSGDSFVLRINKPLDQFLETYKTLYNIPADQESLK